MTTHTSARPRSASRNLKPLLTIAPLAMTLGGLGGLAASSVVFVLAGAAWGVVWTVLAALLATPMLRLRDRSPGYADAAILSAAFIATLTLGAGLVQHVMYPSPEAYLDLMRSDAAGGATGLYMMVNPLLEWLLIPAALALAWHSRQRRLLLIGAAVYYLQRVTTYLYFAPTVLGWTKTSDTVPLSQVALWLDLDLARMTLDLTVIVILATAALRRHAHTPASALRAA